MVKIIFAMRKDFVNYLNSWLFCKLHKEMSKLIVWEFQDPWDIKKVLASYRDYMCVYSYNNWHLAEDWSF